MLNNLQIRSCADCIRRAVCIGKTPCERYEFVTQAASEVIDELTKTIAEAEHEILMLKDEIKQRDEAEG